MSKKNKRLLIYFLIDFVLLIAASFNMPLIMQRAKAPFAVEKNNQYFIVTKILNSEACSALRSGDKILQWNQYEIESPKGLELLCDLSSIGEKVVVSYEQEGIVKITEITLINYYESPRFAIIMAIIALVVWCLALFVAYNRLDGPAAYSLHWALIGLSIASLLTQGHVSTSNIFSILSRMGLLVVYLLTVSLFLFFTTIYPRQKYGSMKLKVVSIFIPALICIAVTIYYFLKAVESPSAVSSFIKVYDIYHVMVVIFCIGIVLSVLDSYRRAQSKEDRARLQWILWGFVVGQAPYLLLLVIPQVLFSKDLIPEEYGVLFFLATIFSFAISFVKYHLLDVEVMINRSIVYALLTLFVGLIYVLTVVLGVSFIGGEIVFTKYLGILLATLLFALLLYPLRLRLQRIVDESLFPTRVHYSKTVAQITDKLSRSLTVGELAQCAVQNAIEAVPLGKISFYVVENEALSCLHSYGDIANVRIVIPSYVYGSMISGHTIALPSALNSIAENIDISYKDWLKNIGYSLCIPIISEAKILRGMITASPIGENDKFAWEEIELLITIAAQASGVLENLILQKKVILEEEELQKMEELNRLQSYFVSGVSHELRTPLASIRMFAETLQQGNIPSKKKQREYIKIIGQESERLSRLVNNVLDFSRVERGVKNYNFDTADINHIIEKSVTTMRYEFEKSRTKLKLNISKKIPKIQADADAIEEVIINMLSNAIRYSGKRKEVVLDVKYYHRNIIISVKDKGIGIPQSETKKIFEPFYQPLNINQSKGMGLGLSLVKHIVEAHNGTITVQSKVGKGSQFTVHLPVTHENWRPVQ